MFKISQLMICGWWQRQLPWTRAVIWPGNPKDRSKFHNYQNLCLRDQTRPLENIFLLLRHRHYNAIAHCFSPTICSQRLLFSPMKNLFSMTLTALKNRDIHIKVFIVGSIYSKTIDIITNFFSSNFKQRAYAWCRAIRIMAPYCM